MSVLWMDDYEVLTSCYILAIDRHRLSVLWGDDVVNVIVERPDDHMQLWRGIAAGT